jgi:hypothetical protein
MNADNMSLKSGLSTVLVALEGPRVARELPHHAHALGRRQQAHITMSRLLSQPEDPDGESFAF